MPVAPHANAIFSYLLLQNLVLEPTAPDRPLKPPRDVSCVINTFSRDRGPRIN